LNFKPYYATFDVTAFGIVLAVIVVVAVAVEMFHRKVISQMASAGCEFFE